MARHHRRSLDRLVPLLAEGRHQVGAAAGMPGDAQENGLIGGAFSALIAARLRGDPASSLPALALELLEFFLAPFLGLVEGQGESGTRM